MGSKVSSNQNKIINLMKEDSNITKKELFDKLDIGKTSIDNNIAKLKELGKLRRVGSDKSGHWEILK